MSVFGIHEKALLLRELRTEVLASNLTNADTPHYKARDFDFNKVLTNQLDNESGHLMTTSSKHIAGTQNVLNIEKRVAENQSLDGNTVDPQKEHAEHAENALHYLSSLAFIKNRTTQIIMALKGGE